MHNVLNLLNMRNMQNGLSCTSHAVSLQVSALYCGCGYVGPAHWEQHSSLSLSCFHPEMHNTSSSSVLAISFGTGKSPETTLAFYANAPPISTLHYKCTRCTHLNIQYEKDFSKYEKYIFQIFQRIRRIGQRFFFFENQDS